MTFYRQLNKPIFVMVLVPPLLSILMPNNKNEVFNTLIDVIPTIKRFNILFFDENIGKIRIISWGSAFDMGDNHLFIALSDYSVNQTRIDIYSEMHQNNSKQLEELINKISQILNNKPEMIKKDQKIFPSQIDTINQNHSFGNNVSQFELDPSWAMLPRDCAAIWGMKDPGKHADLIKESNFKENELIEPLVMQTKKFNNYQERLHLKTAKIFGPKSENDLWKPWCLIGNKPWVSFSTRLPKYDPIPISLKEAKRILLRKKFWGFYCSLNQGYFIDCLKIRDNIYLLTNDEFIDAFSKIGLQWVYDKDSRVFSDRRIHAADEYYFDILYYTGESKLLASSPILKFAKMLGPIKAAIYFSFMFYGTHQLERRSGGTSGYGNTDSSTHSYIHRNYVYTLTHPNILNHIDDFIRFSPELFSGYLDYFHGCCGSISSYRFPPEGYIETWTDDRLFNHIHSLSKDEGLECISSLLKTKNRLFRGPSIEKIKDFIEKLPVN